MFEAIMLNEKLNSVIVQINYINEAQWKKIEELEQRIEMLENKG